MSQTKVGFSFIWRIENFSHALEKKDESISSPHFKVTDSDKISWWVMIYPRGCKDDNYVSCYLICNIPDKSGFSANCELTLLSADGKSMKSISSNKTFERPGIHIFGFNYFVSRKILLQTIRAEYLSEDTLTVCCRILSINSKNVEAGLCFARSRIGVQKTSFIWSMEDFSKLKTEQRASITSESVSTRMDLFFKSGDLEQENIHIEISQVDICRKNVSSCKISLLGVNGKTVVSKKDEHFFKSKNESNQAKEVWRFPDFINKSLLLSDRGLYLPRDVLTLHCELAVSVGVIENKIENFGKGLIKRIQPKVDLHESLWPNHSHTLTKDLKQLCKDEKHWDVSLRVKSATFPAHRIILSARSAVFSAMFESEMTESKTGVVDIPDLDEDTVRRMLIFIYEDTVEDLLWKDTVNLYTASNKYDIPGLRKKCSSLLLSRANESNILDLLVLANIHADGYLKEKAVDFLLGREKEILKSVEWRELVKDNCLLSVEIAQQIIQRK